MKTKKDEEISSDRRYHHGDLRNALLDAALELLRERGAEGLSLREVARVAGVSANAPYRHFADKDALLAELMAVGFERLTAALDSSHGITEAEARLTRFVEIYLRFAAENQPLYRLMVGGVIDRFSPYPRLAEAAQASFASLLRLMEGLQDPVSVPTVVRLWASVHGLASLRIEGTLGFLDEEQQPGPQDLARSFLASLP